MKHKKVIYSFERTDFLFLFFVFFAFVFSIKLFSTQVLNHQKFQAKAQEQYQSLQVIQASRGNIYDKDGYPLASGQKAYLLYFEPKKVVNSVQTSQVVAQILTDVYVESLLTENLTSDQEKLKKLEKYDYYFKRFQELTKLDLFWVAAEHNVLPETKQKIEEKNLAGVGFEEVSIRYYPEKNLASHILGYVAKNEQGDFTGYFGIEGYFNRDLNGKPGRVVQEYDAVGSPILVGKYKKIDPINGTDTILTIDRAIQYTIEKKLEEGVKKYKAVSGTIIVTNPLTSEILGMANFPSYSPTNFGAVGDKDDEYKPQTINKAISFVYEPGSVIKPLTVASGIDLGVITKDSQFNDAGPVEYSDYTIDNWDGKHHSVQNMTQLLQKSNNIGSAWVAHKIGAKKLHEYFSNFGLGSVTGIELEGEDTGSLKNPKDMYDIDLATAGFGQGMSATPLQVLNSFNVIANEGLLQKPRIVKELKNNGRIIPLKARPLKRVLKEETAKIVEEMLIDTVSGGEAKFFVLKNYKVAGKTGTAEIPKDGKYSKNETNATFVGYMPTSKAFSMIVKLEKPKTSTYAAETAVPLWMDVAQDLINYYGLVPDTDDFVFNDFDDTVADVSDVVGAVAGASLDSDGAVAGASLASDGAVAGAEDVDEVEKAVEDASKAYESADTDEAVDDKAVDEEVSSDNIE